MKLRTILAATVLTVTAVLTGAGAATADDNNGFTVIDVSKIPVSCLLPVLSTGVECADLGQ
ncbi:hypothetical protein ACFVP3_36815 [Streptomyces sp. NPDC057806]|uniref:hypothetical protein n=1 Tax=Streptomyces sp. NPDC057806 TaxID=3346255 RepID=UPI0036A54578